LLTFFGLYDKEEYDKENEEEGFSQELTEDEDLTSRQHRDVGQRL